MLVYYFVPFIVSNRYLLFWVSNGHNSVPVQNRTHFYMNFFHHKDLGNHLLQLCPKVMKHPVYTGCPRRKGPNFRRVFLRSNYTDITQNTYIQSSMITEILAREVWNFDSWYTLIDYQIHIKTGRNMWFL